MSLHVIENLEQGTPEWHDARRGMVTASVVGKLITAKTLKPASNDYSRALTMQLAAERITGWTDPSYFNADMARGVEHEPFAREAYVEQTGVEVREVGFMVRDFDGFQIGFSPDGLVDDDGSIEIKCPRAKGHVTTILSDRVPTQYLAQVQTGLLVSGRDWIDYVSFVGGMPLYVKRVTPDPAWFEAITEAARLAEQAIAETVAAYQTTTAGRPLTERVPDPFEEMRI